MIKLCFYCFIQGNVVYIYTFLFVRHFKTIRTNMHVFLLYPLLLDNEETQPEKSSALQTHISKALSLCCCVEVYRPWSSEALVESALYHLKDNHHVPELKNAGESVEYC